MDSSSSCDKEEKSDFHLNKMSVACSTNVNASLFSLSLLTTVLIETISFSTVTRPHIIQISASLLLSYFQSVFDFQIIACLLLFCLKTNLL